MRKVFNATGDRHARIAIAAFAATAAMIFSAVALEKTIERRSPACAIQKDVDSFYDLMRNQPSMQDLAEFLRAHECLTLQSGTRVSIEQEDAGGLYYCVRTPARKPCYWIRQGAFRR